MNLFKNNKPRLTELEVQSIMELTVLDITKELNEKRAEVRQSEEFISFQPNTPEIALLSSYLEELETIRSKASEITKAINSLDVSSGVYIEITSNINRNLEVLKDKEKMKAFPSAYALDSLKYKLSDEYKYLENTANLLDRTLSASEFRKKLKESVKEYIKTSK